MLGGCEARLNKKFNASQTNSYDVILYSGKIDALNNYKFGKLPYRSLEFSYQENESWEESRYGTINLPQDLMFIRKANFKILHQQKSELNWIQYQKPTNESEENLPMYPVNTDKSEEKFLKYLLTILDKYPKIIPIGRLGLFKYLDMDKAVSLSLKMVSIVNIWKDLTLENKFEAIQNFSLGSL